LVTPEQAEILSLASNESKIQLILRNPLDTETSKTEGSNMATLFSGIKTGTPGAPTAVRRAPAAVKPPVAPTPVVQAPPAVYLIEVINGLKKDQATFKKPGEASPKTGEVQQ
jgi:pilus assembly protein CpaB